MGEERARLFVALELPGVVRDALMRGGEGMTADEPGMRPLAAERLHVTLCFLGWRAEGELDEIASACGVLAAEPAAELALGEALWLPARRPRVLAIRVSDCQGALASAQSALSLALQSGDWYAPEARPFLAHVTVARAGHGARLGRRELRPPAPLGFTGSTATLYRSWLGPGGARYQPLRSVRLGPAAALQRP